jgi:hypothetical protein
MAWLEASGSNACCRQCAMSDEAGYVQLNHRINGRLALGYLEPGRL